MTIIRRTPRDIAAMAFCLTVGLLAPFACPPRGDRATRIDRTIVRMVDLTRDGKPEKVTLRIQGESIRDPFKWAIEIDSDGRRIFFKEQVDSRIDRFFNDPQYIQGCNDYESCKKKWYFDELMDNFLVEADPSLSEILQKKAGPFPGYNDLAGMICQTGKATLDEAKKIIESLKRDVLDGRVIGIEPEVNPAYFTGIYLWIPVIEDFIKVYDD